MWFFDHSCGLDPYLLNREPRDFEFLRVLTDGAHWSSQKQFKKPDSQGKGGHKGCSESFNFNQYKQSLSEENSTLTLKIIKTLYLRVLTLLKTF